MYMVYWTATPAPALASAGGQDGAAVPQARQFESSEMLAAIAFMEQLRTRQRAGEGVGFVTMCSENPDSVGHPGVDVTGPGYGWTKRRRR